MKRIWTYLSVRVAQRLLDNPSFIAELSKKIDQQKIDRCSRQTTLGKGSRFYELSKVSNLRKDPSLIRIGTDTHIRGDLTLFRFGGEITIGNNCYVGEGTRIWSAEKVTIGNNVLISHNVNIIDTDSHEMNHLARAESFASMVRDGHATSQGDIKTSPVVIGDYAWISYNSSILKGVTIGKGAIIGAGSVVTRDVPDFAIVAGNPAVVLRQAE